ncbi:hypothetical protein QRX50_40280 [Amycolatopsis carbonis]|uniref:Uncharacterized protein n=1 Tax=Amycolatopsis carbonis TaxID=715471 RepID=A0A9Y2IFG2_9PSEU|nr:hypothetical protein [Amycolatopsis sp. 2-15]WIX77583.1 hypothetical protein QRX50_40280 [Amycolatopsis sp. 2-15]
MSTQPAKGQLQQLRHDEQQAGPAVARLLRAAAPAAERVLG